MYPYDTHIITEVDYLPSSVTDRPNPRKPAPDIDDQHEEEPTHLPLPEPPQEVRHIIRNCFKPPRYQRYQAEARKNTTRQKKDKSMIATGTPEKQEIEEKCNKSH